jgi:hypothetical protein
MTVFEGSFEEIDNSDKLENPESNEMYDEFPDCTP